MGRVVFGAPVLFTVVGWVVTGASAGDIKRLTGPELTV